MQLEGDDKIVASRWSCAGDLIFMNFTKLYLARGYGWRRNNEKFGNWQLPTVMPILQPLRLLRHDYNIA
jgi:hypothetical protein